MDGVVIVVARTGALQCTRSFSGRFDRLHPKNNRLNLAALLFALQNFAADSIHDDSEVDDATSPPITLFETAAERIVMARSHSHGLLIALFVRPQWDAVVARSTVRRIATYYDHEYGIELPLITPLTQNAQTFRHACEHAIQHEVDAYLEAYATSLYAGHESKRPTVDFVLLHYAPSGDVVADGNCDISDDGHDDDYRDDAMAANGPSENAKELRLASPRSTTSSPDPLPSRLQKLYASMRSLLPQPSIGNGRRCKPKKNAVMNLATPKSFQRFVLFPAVNAGTGAGSEDALTTLLGHPQFANTLVNALQPTTALLAPPTRLGSAVRILGDGVWHNFSLPQLLSTTSNARIVVDLRFWVREGCFLVHLNSPLSGVGAKARASALLDRIEPLAQCAVRLSK